MPVRFDDSKWPIVTAVFGGDSSDEDFLRFFEQLEAYYRRNERFVLAVDAGSSTGVSSAQRKLMADKIEQQAPLSSKLMIQPIVLHTAVQRGVLTALNWISPPPYPQKVCKTLEEAIAWGQEQLQPGARSVA